MSATDDYDFELPRELIAQHPLPHRSDSRLMVVDRRTGSIEHSHVRNLPEWLAPDDALVLNDTQVVKARLVGRRRETGGRWQGLFLHADQQGLWRMLCKTRGKMRSGEHIDLDDRLGRPSAQLEMVLQLEDGSWVVRPPEGAEPLDLLERVGRVPLPHYIRGGEMVDADVESYQTVYAEKPGSVAAPTAGLHFTPKLLGEIQNRGVALCRITLHVGVGTFKPIAATAVEEHQMHAEWGELSERTCEVLAERRAAGGRIVAVGTTSVRVLETAARSGSLQPFRGETNLYIHPPFEFHGIDAMMTNFHLPRSTLLVLVRTFGGDALMRHAYKEAVEGEYRFFSYGDAMLIL